MLEARPSQNLFFSSLLVIPREIEGKVLQLAQEIEEAEEGIRKAVAGGMKLVEARKKFRYHALQHK
jgi:regulator of RNase E activity RraA